MKVHETSIGANIPLTASIISESLSKSDISCADAHNKAKTIINLSELDKLNFLKFRAKYKTAIISPIYISPIKYSFSDNIRPNRNGINKNL
jgi:hypothetical protein